MTVAGSAAEILRRALSHSKLGVLVAAVVVAVHLVRRKGKGPNE
jgi:hypothetical protein